MHATQLVRETTRLVRRGTDGVLDVFGPTVEFLILPKETEGYCVMIGTIPPGVSVPLHSHLIWRAFFSFPERFGCSLSEGTISNGWM